MDNPELPIGTVIDNRYVLEAMIGKGGMAAVYRAHDRRSRTQVAIKIMRIALSESTNRQIFITRFEREAEILRRLTHTNILRLFDYGTQGDNLIYLVVELESESLADRFRELHQNGQYLPLTEIDRILSQLVPALDYAHSKNIIHRDLKPDNILFNENDDVILSDFGIAKQLDNATLTTQTFQLLGSMNYAAPEQWSGAHVDPRTDVYALGAIVYQMLSDQLPFSATTYERLLYQHIHTPPPPLNRPDLRPGTVSALNDVIGKAMSKDPEDRYASASDLLAAYKSAISSTLTAVNTTRRRPALVPILGGLAVLLLILVIGAFAFILRQQQTTPTAFSIAVVSSNTALPTITTPVLVPSAVLPSSTVLSPSPVATSPSAVLSPSVVVPSLVAINAASIGSSASPTIFVPTVPPSVLPTVLIIPTLTNINPATGTVILAATDVPTSTITPTSIPSRTPTTIPTIVPSSTPTIRPTSTDTLTHTMTATSTNTATPTSTAPPTVTATATPTATITITPSETTSPTITNTFLPPRIDTIGVYGNGAFYLRLHNSTGFTDYVIGFNFSSHGYPVVGDWTGDGFDRVGLFDQQSAGFKLCTAPNNGNCSTSSNLIQFMFGNSDDIPLAGRWTSDATHDGVGIFRSTTDVIFFKNSLTDGSADYNMTVGLPGDRPLAGDWTGKNYDTPGVYRASNSTFYLYNRITMDTIAPEIVFPFALADGLPIAGDWSNTGYDGIGLLNPISGSVALKYRASAGDPDLTFTYHATGTIPVAGHWQLIYPPTAAP